MTNGYYLKAQTAGSSMKIIISLLMVFILKTAGDTDELIFLLKFSELDLKT